MIIFIKSEEIHGFLISKTACIHWEVLYDALENNKGSLADYMYTLLYMRLCLYVTENTCAPLF